MPPSQVLRRSALTRDISPELATQLLARASELDAIDGSNASLLELRAAAIAAGISEVAFDGALAELQTTANTRRDRFLRGRRRKWVIAAALAAVAAASLLGVAFMRNLQAPRDPMMVTQMRAIRCISPESAERLISPLLTLRDNSVAFTKVGLSGSVMTLYGTEEQLREVAVVLDPYEVRAGATCSNPLPAPSTP